MSNAKRYQIRQMFQKAKYLERKGQWTKAASVLRTILRDWDPADAYSHLALAKLEARRHAHVDNSTVAVAAFERGTQACPTSVHLWQAWAIYEESMGHTERARELLEKALQLDRSNPYVCHAYGLLERKMGNDKKALELWQRALKKTSTAALVCSLGELLIAQKKFDQARDLYARHVLRLKTPRERTEVYLASAWLEERYFRDFDRAQELLHQALEMNPTSSLAQIALARLEGRGAGGTSQEEFKRATVRRLANACNVQQTRTTKKSHAKNQKHNPQQHQQYDEQQQQPQDGRVYNAWAHMEVQSGRSAAARKILQTGMERHPTDHSLLQAAGKIEERLGNYSGARDLYSASLYIQPSAPTLVSYALLELRHPESSSSTLR